MSSPKRPKLLPLTSHQSTRYEVDVQDPATGQWYLAHQRKTLEGAKKAKARLDSRGWHSRLVAVSETRRLIEAPHAPFKPQASICSTCEKFGIGHPGFCDSSGTLGDMKP